MCRVLYSWNTFIGSILEVKTNTIDYKNFDALLSNLNSLSEVRQKKNMMI